MRKEQAGMSQTQYAKSRGLNQSWVGELQHRGVLILLPNGRIDPGPSDEARARVITPRIRRASPNASKDSFFQARAMREAYSAKLAKLEYEKQTGKLVDSDKILALATQAFSNVRTRMRGLGRALAPVLAQRSTAEIERILNDAVDGALLVLSTDIFATDASEARGDATGSPNIQ